MKPKKIIAWFILLLSTLVLLYFGLTEMSLEKFITIILIILAIALGSATIWAIFELID